MINKFIKYNKKNNYLNALIVIGIFVILIANAGALMQFYNGKIIQDNVKIDILIENGTANVNAEYGFLNIGSSAEKVKLSFPSYQNAVIELNEQEFKRGDELELASGEKQIIKILYSMSANEIFNLAPEVLFNGKAHEQKIRRYIVNLHFANSGAKLTNYMPEFIEINDANLNGRNYLYDEAGVYSSLISFEWTEIQTNIFVSRSISEISRQGDILEATTSITNNGDELNNLELQDAFLSANYKPISPIEEFKKIDSEFEPVYSWTKKINSLGAGETLTFSYKLNVTNIANLRLLPLRVLMDGELIDSVEGRYLNIAEPIQYVQEINETNASAENETIYEKIEIPIDREFIISQELPISKEKDKGTPISKNIIIAILILTLIAVIYLIIRNKDYLAYKLYLLKGGLR